MQSLHGDGEAGGAGAAAARDTAGLLLASAIIVVAPAFALRLRCCRRRRCQRPRLPSSLWQQRGGQGRGGGCARRCRPPPGLGNCRRGTGLCPGAVDAVNVLFEDGATGAGVFHGVGTGAGSGFDAIFGMFVDELCVALIERPTPLERRPHRRLHGDLC